MSRTNFLALVVAILFLLAAVADLAMRPDNWVAMLAVALGGTVVSMAVGIVSRRRAQAA
jgi:F0F1-type ATP synthase membrane subunit c/vacuolar-type H+-ATPase subunit K